MRNHFYLLFLISTFANAQNISFPDTNFKNALLTFYSVDTNNDLAIDSDADLNNDGEIDLSEATNITHLYFNNLNISNLSGIENFTELIVLHFSNNPISTVDLSNLNNLEYIECNQTNLTSINLCGTIAIKLYCESNPFLSSIYLKNNVISPTLLGYERLTPPYLPSFVFGNCPLLTNICYDEGELPAVSNAFMDNLTGLNLTTSCDANCVLSIGNFNNNEITLFPNPVKNEMNFSFEKNISIEKINIYNTLGQLVKQFIGNQNSINLSDLNTGYYHIEFISEEGKLTKKFIKE